MGQHHTRYTIYVCTRKDSSFALSHQTSITTWKTRRGYGHPLVWGTEPCPRTMRRYVDFTLGINNDGYEGEPRRMPHDTPSAPALDNNAGNDVIRLTGTPTPTLTDETGQTA